MVNEAFSDARWRPNPSFEAFSTQHPTPSAEPHDSALLV